MAASVFHRVRTGSKLGAQYDQDGNLIQVRPWYFSEGAERGEKLLEVSIASLLACTMPASC